MLKDSDLKELLQYTPGAPVLSVYLNLDPSLGNAEVHKLRLRSLLKTVNLPEDTAAVDQFISHEFDWSGRGVVVFSCAAHGFLRAYPLAVPVLDLIRVSDRPVVKPLADLWDNYGGYGVALVDKQGARLFFFHMGELSEQEGILGQEVKHVKRGGASTFPGRRGGIAGRTRHAEELVERNLKEIAEFAARFFEEKHIRRILIGGTDENVASLRGLLPRHWQSLVMGTFTMAMTASHTEVLNKALQLGKTAELEHEARLVDEMTDLAAKGGAAVLGLEKTLEAIHRDQVKRMMILPNLRSRGFICDTCGRLTVHPAEACPACGAKLVPTSDVVEFAVSGVLRNGGDVQVVHDNNPALEKAGGIGAVLRF
jgi:peptide subunit release factor 1 (eRF1)